MNPKLMSVGALITLTLGLLAWRVAWATPASGVTTTILSGPVDFDDDLKVKSESDTNEIEIEMKGSSDVYIVLNVIVPGGHTGWHSHPGISFVTVRAGTATEYSGDDPNTPNVYPAGSGFVEAAGHAHIIRNEGTTNLELVAFQIVPSGAVRRIDAPQP